MLKRRTLLQTALAAPVLCACATAARARNRRSPIQRRFPILIPMLDPKWRG